MTPAAFRKLALSMPGAVEAPHFDRASFRIGTKIFATMKEDGSQAMVPVKPLYRCYELIEAHPELFFSFGGWTQKLGSLGIHLKAIDAKTVKPLLIEAFERLAPKKKPQLAKSSTKSTPRRTSSSPRPDGISAPPATATEMPRTRKPR